MKKPSFGVVVVGLSGAAIAVMVAGYMGAFGSETDIAAIDISSPVTIALGKKIYAQQCAACHGPNLEGQPNWRSRLADGSLPAPPHDETGHTWHHPDALLFGVTKYGGAKNAPSGFVSGMPAFGEKLTDREIGTVLAYIKSRWPEPVRERQARINAQVLQQK
ncbi:MAG: mono/diheme cytochrome c family protein [Paracoccaceae bacterium]|jgi:mono/diheme cytochrome c family protein